MRGGVLDGVGHPVHVRTTKGSDMVHRRQRVRPCHPSGQRIEKEQMSPDFTIIDEFANMPEIGDEWVDRHGVDRSPDAEAQRIDDAYEKYRDYDADKEAAYQKAVAGECKWCRMPNGDHHPDCCSGSAERRVTAADILRIKMAQQTVAQRAAMEMEYEPMFDIGEGVWKIAASTEVFVSDNKGILRGHRMKKDAVYSESNVMGNEVNCEQTRPMKFLYPFDMGHQLSTTLGELIEKGWVVIQTGVSRWPYLIVLQKHVIVVYESAEAIVGERGGTCRKLGY